MPIETYKITHICVECKTEHEFNVPLKRLKQANVFNYKCGICFKQNSFTYTYVENFMEVHKIDSKI